MAFAARQHIMWPLCTRTLALGPRTCIMGILNVTPDSFSDGGLHYDPQHRTDRAIQHALTMLDAGADILDIGGESTRPGSTPLTPAEEQSRILPVIRELLRAHPHAILSIDTYHAETARLATAAGAEIINDVSGLTWDPNMAATCARLACGVILMHTRGRPHEWKTQPSLAPNEVTPLVIGGLHQRIEAAIATGIERNRIAIDPGFGFGKLLDENWPLLAGLDQLNQFHLPIVAGISRKRFLARAVSQRLNNEAPPATSRVQATTAANVAAILSGAHILRVHDVAPAVEAAAVADAILASASATGLA